MAADATTFISELPPWMQYAANAALFVVTVATGIFALKKSHKAEAEKPDEAFDAEDLLQSTSVKQFIENVSTIADNMKLQTEALKNISAAATAIGKTVEEDYDERRVNREVDRRLAEEQLRRNMRSS